ncbi:ComEC/Rec2 family competence protein, partial [Demequina sp.]|uniref:ComEC/Rec2 family competence protein n=1 Tax=Demequina sp. TaxID=2050685 RepID=UPI0025F43CF2
MPGWGDLRLAPAAVSAWTASLAAGAWGARGAALAIACWLLVAAAVSGVRRTLRGRALRADSPSWGPAVVLAVVAAAVASGTALGEAGSRAWLDHATGGAVIEVAARVGESRTLDTPGEGVVLRLSASGWRPSAHEAWRDASGVLAMVVEADGAPPRGSQVRARGRVTAAAGGAVDGLLDGAVLDWVDSQGWRGAAERSRQSFVGLLSGVDPTAGAMVRGMVLGDTSAMGDQLVSQVRVSGLAHLTAVSGAHFAILAAAVGGALRRARARPAVVAGATLAACAALAATVSGGGSVVRAVAMAAIAAAAL